MKTIKDIGYKKMTELTKIANECKTDKGTCFNESHGYTEYYEAWLEKYTSPKILEIGSWHGASTKMFDDYYKHNCEIWTFDISYGVYEYKMNKDNIHCFIGDQNSKHAWDMFFEQAPDKFDIIIDDGSHMPEHQMHTLYWLYSHLAPNGIYILEDLHTYIWDKKKNSPLMFLNFWEENEWIGKSQVDEMFKHLKDETIIHIKNENSDYCKRSITSILRFE